MRTANSCSTTSNTSNSTNLADRVLATSVVPYPPGIPMLMPGESTGPDDGPYLSYLRALQGWDARFPGFGHDTHGVEEPRRQVVHAGLKKDAATKTARKRGSDDSTVGESTDDSRFRSIVC